MKSRNFQYIKVNIVNINPKAVATFLLTNIIFPTSMTSPRAAPGLFSQIFNDFLSTTGADRVDRSGSRGRERRRIRVEVDQDERGSRLPQGAEDAPHEEEKLSPRIRRMPSRSFD